MAQINVYNKEFQEIDKIEIRDDIFNIEPNMDVLYRYVDMQLTNKRAGTASTKTRAEVRGGGRKPWPQKHTGRARAGSIRSPIFRHGGVAFGPKPKEYHKSLNKKMKKLALKSALSVRFRENNLIILDDLKFDNPKTKDMKEVLNKFGIENKKVLIVLPYKEEGYKNVKLSAKNLPQVKVLIADNSGQNKKNIDGLNVFDLINNEKIVLTREMVNKIEEVIG
ncbi:MAG: 50S ribosomal protein L4 [Defluviitoga tunisiensis]|jgi:large subunit ribosomal protein L4|uniref:Large ribosomal subunit protein uL4 n=1 Tax=Defluviitoga tunisiensis TaxID=1006576 RepID=A0A0C7P0D2_DEFTU|nr:50S ribosomal protein L4 [Defluviitoga tunisiensis]MDD3600696.1 50S ribosomal protein L4 [Defluviitoga tunisiensis]MDY0379191.1 50S ribosomal protein L4 [Defluviitoga tunisiensis]CEP77489.1 50S ribosomal protein L4 [Defluviitoga tunisiensis]HHV01274.1 50S ribosomal protein L4 [Defluviitoga tunisiensis]HOB55131.1 50S ribosomal protein L4 [Defluviitoga tunisiensis]